MSQNHNSIVKIYKPKEKSFVKNISQPETTIPKSIRVFFFILIGIGADCGALVMLSGRIRSMVKYYMTLLIILDIIIIVSAITFMLDELWC